MGTDNLFKKRKEERVKRKENVRKQKSNNWLVICEGKQTEPNYFKSVINDINKDIDDEYKLKVKIVGMGMNTISLVESANEFLSNIDEYKLSIIPYGKIFVVFDKDDFISYAFDKAIKICNENGYIPLWSNQAIEYWFLLHFNFIEGKMNRKLYKSKINEYFKSLGLDYNYTKNDKEIYNKLMQYGSLEQARKNALKIYLSHISDKPSNAESCTTIYRFFDAIDDRLEELK